MNRYNTTYSIAANICSIDYHLLVLLFIKKMYLTLQADMHFNKF